MGTSKNKELIKGTKSEKKFSLTLTLQLGTNINIHLFNIKVGQLVRPLVKFVKLGNINFLILQRGYSMLNNLQIFSIQEVLYRENMSTKAHRV